MKKTSKILILLLIFSMILSLAACKKTEIPDDEGEVQEETANDEENTDLEGTTLNIVATSESYKEFFDKFTNETGINVEFISMSSGELLSRVRAEEGKPMAD